MRLGVMLVKVRLLPKKDRGERRPYGPPFPSFRTLEVETDGAGDRARRDVMRATEGGKEIVERDVVGQVDHFHASAELVAVIMEVEDVIVSNGEIKQVPRSDARWMTIVVLSVRPRYLNQRGTELRCEARIRQRRRRSSVLAAAEEPRLEFLIGGEGISEGVFHQDSRLAA